MKGEEKTLPSIDIIIPTLNAQRSLSNCLKSINHQRYPKNKIQIIIADGGSTDKTIEIAKRYKAKVINNPLKTAEAGKAIGLKFANSDLVALIDSDNILPNQQWLKTMVVPFSDHEIIGSEPYKFTYRKKAGIIERYSALIGANDPYAYITGVYDRFSFISQKWTSLRINFEDKKIYYKLELKPNLPIPTIGANGTIFRTEFLKNNFNSEYLFDIDVLASFTKKTKKSVFFAKTKVGIIHTYCENSIKKFIRKQNRRIVDFYIYRPKRQYDWTSSNKPMYKFIFYVTTIAPSLYDATKGFIRKPDIVWLLHPIFCQITMIIYVSNFIKAKLNFLKEIDRKNWSQ